MGTDGMISVRGSIVRPHGLDDRPAGAPPAAGRLGSTSARRLRQHPWVHQVAQRVDRSSRRRGAHQAHHYRGSGYHYEADEVRTCVERGATESAVMPLDDSIEVAATADLIRHSIRLPSGPSEGTP